MTDTRQVRVPHAREVSIIETNIARFGWRDGAGESVRVALGWDWNEFQQRWPGGLDDLFRDIYIHRCRRCCEDTAHALSAHLNENPASGETALADLALETAAAAWEDFQWRIIALEYGARLLRYPELLSGFADLAASATTDLTNAIAGAARIDLSQAAAIVSELVRRCPQFGVGPWRNLVPHARAR